MKSFLSMIFVVAMVPLLSNVVDATEALKIAKKIVCERPVVLEAGAHYGEHTVVLSRLWPDGHIHAFEPYPAAYKKLVEATQHLSNVTCYPVALFDRNGSVSFNIAQNLDAASSILEPSAAKKKHYRGPKIEVPCMTLAEWQKKYDIDHIDFFWLDMEGVELPVLQHNPELLASTAAMYIEVNFAEHRIDMTQYHQLNSFLKQQGFLDVYWHPYPWRQADILYARKEIE